MKKKLFLAISGFMMVVFTSCLDNLFCIKGDGVIETERRASVVFDQIENSTSFDIVYMKKDTSGISINADQNIIDYIVTETSGSTLEIKTSPRDACFNFSRTPVITVSSPGLSSALISGSGSFLAGEMGGDAVALKLSGSGDITAHRINCHDLTLLMSGSGSITLDDTHCINADTFLSGSGNISINGDCLNNHIKISGSGNVHADSFLTGSASVIISGSGNAFVNIEERLTGIISGSGNIYVKGNPVIDVTVSGSGRVIKTN